jgi:hypothetical protein
MGVGVEFLYIGDYMNSFFNILLSGSFWQGFFRGLSSPAYIFGYKDTEPLELKQVKTHIGSIESDWAKIGGDMRRAMEKYGETHPI